MGLQRYTIAALFLLWFASIASALDSKRDALWAAVRAGDVKAAKEAVEKGANVAARNEYGVTALWIAVGKGKLDVVQFLVSKGADVNARDDIWYQTPLSGAVGGSHIEMVKFLIKSGAKDVDAAVLTAAALGNVAMVQAILDLSKVSQESLDGALYIVSGGTNKKLKEALEKAGAKPIPQASEADRKSWSKLIGSYDSDGGQKMVIAVKDVGLIIGGRYVKPIGPDTFEPLGTPGASYRIERKDGEVSRIVMKRLSAEYSFYKFKPPVTKAKVPANAGAKAVASPMNWPSFRGPDGTGVADGQNPPIAWNGVKGESIRWKTPISGLGHSCPVVWGNRVFLTTAISSGQADPKIRVGNYGDVNSVNDTSKHTWQVICLDRDSGKVLWSKTAHEGVPKIKRHLKGSQANCTPATDGRHVVACFGSEGLYCYDFDGKLLWQRDLSTLDSSFALDVEYEWGFANSPILYDGRCILQCDLSRDSFIAAFSLEDGSKIWSTPRDEIPSWSSPVVWRNAKRTEIVTNASQYARAYDPASGAELWRLAKKSEATIPTPVIGKNMVYIASGNRPIQPIVAILPGAVGDISLTGKEETNSSVAWSRMRGGPYMPTPILYGDYLYTCSNAGVVTCYQAATGKEIYKERIGGASYTASPVAGDGRLYFISEQGEIRVVKAGPTFELLSVNEMGDNCLASPAISNGVLFVRTQHFLWAVGAK
ncbi:MAG TPA: PQQ-binding-like beta-propeller repeat protein [Gemmataceae bacterium]|jgi:outer membrane protein assembly factor BamB|nr:PQQ-binding-like beta-propeller repeat protein [Gemmataceae bacterium]